jgi:hypothetical protein
MNSLRLFKTKWFDRFSRKNSIDDKTLREAVERAERGLVDADLGSGVIKQRIARQGQGKSSGYRIIILMKIGHRTFFVYGFAKSDQENISQADEEQFREMATHYLAMSDHHLLDVIDNGNVVEVGND